VRALAVEDINRHMEDCDHGYCISDLLCGLCSEFLATDPEDPGPIAGATRFSE
jgi:hypothetical protein